MKVLSQKPFGDKCAHHRFDGKWRHDMMMKQWHIDMYTLDVPHGFAAARGDYTDELHKKRATEAIQLTANFFSKVLSDNWLPHTHVCNKL